MAIISRDSGCKVGWVTFDNEDEAKAESEKQREAAKRSWAAGYDFGFQSPGEIVRRRRYTEVKDGKPDASGPWEYLDEWTVTTV